MLCVVTVIAGCDVSRLTLQNDSAQVVGVYEVCRGPYSGHCYVQKRGSVTVLNENHHLAASRGFATNGRFAVWLVPGPYTLIASAPSGVRQSRSVNAVSGTTTANIRIRGPVDRRQACLRRCRPGSLRRD